MEQENAEAILKLSHKYGMESLLQQSIKYLRDRPLTWEGDPGDTWHVLRWLKLADMLNIDDVVDMCISRIITDTTTAGTSSRRVCPAYYGAGR
jgi:hypothetical protein